jgi:molecular chaperone HscA
MHARKVRESRVEAERMVLATRSALAADGDLLDREELAGIEALLRVATEAARGEDAQAIDAAVQALAQGTEAFAAARMNRGIRAALAGRRVDEV